MGQKYFVECRYCKPPKRHPGCHGTCEDYIKSKAAYDAEAEEQRARREEVRRYIEFKGENIARTKRKIGMVPKGGV